MTATKNKETAERKRYRNTFIIHALLGAAGIAAGVYIYKYTDLIGGTADGYVYACRMDLRELLERYYCEARYMFLLFACGFTIYAVPAAIIFSVARGFLCGAGIMRLASFCNENGISGAHFVMTAVFMSSVMIIEIIMAAKTACNVEDMRSIAPRADEMIRDKNVKRFAATFAMLCGVLFAAVSAVYFAPLLPF